MRTRVVHVSGVASRLRHQLSLCRLCPRNCGTDRVAGVRGPCGLADRPRLSAARQLYAEEPWLSGTAGSGAIFLSGCVQACVFCQNYDFNIQREGKYVSVEHLAGWFLWLQKAGCHNIHWITPTHQLPWLLEALALARNEGLTLPIVYNTGGYESLEVLQALEGIIDIYLPDFKFWSEDLSRRYLRLRGYPDVARMAILEMHRQVGHLQLDADGIAQRGLLVRHLVMPGCLDDANNIYRWLAEEVGVDTFVTVNTRYRPLYRADRHVQIARPSLPEECHKAVHLAKAAGLHNLFVQDVDTAPVLSDLLLQVPRV